MPDDAPPEPRAATPRERATERQALLLGLVLAACTLAAIGLALALAPALGRGLAAQAVTQVVIGRETGLPTGLALHNPPALVAALGAAQDTIVLLVGYGLVMMAARGSLRIRWLSRLADRPHERREEFGARTEPVGIVLLALGLWIPFLPSGALVAALIARVAGYRPHLFLPALAVSAILADFAYVYALDQLARVIPRWMLPLFALGVVVLVGGTLAVRKWLEKRKAR